MDKAKLTTKQDKFVKAYLLNGGNATQAAIDAGYKADNAAVVGCENLTKPAIKAAFSKSKEEIESRLYSGVINDIQSLKDEIKRLKALVGEAGGRRGPKANNRYSVMHRAGFKCQCCGAKPSSNNEVVLHIDHITPFSSGGNNECDNLQVLCSKCNISKSNFYDFDHNEDL